MSSRNSRRTLLAALTMIAALGSPHLASGQEPAAAEPAMAWTDQPDCCRRPWKFRVMPYGWVPAFEGDLTVRSLTAPVDCSVGKTLDIFVTEINFAAIGQIEASNGRVGMIFNGVYGDFQPSKEVRGLDFTSDLELAVLDWVATYEVGCFADRFPGARLELLAGVRYISLSTGVTLTGPRGNSVSDSGSQDWVDPIIGARLRMPLLHRLTGQVRADIGGFSVGSQFTWNIETTLEYRLSSRCSFFAGYRWLDIDYRSGDFGFDMNLNGPLMGIALDF